MLALTTHGSARAFDHVVGFAAVRGDYYPDGFGLTINPQLGLVLDLEDYGRVRATLARGFRAPNLYEANWLAVDDAANITTRAPNDLGPEHSETREVSYERYLSKHVRAIGVVFTQEITDLIALSTSPSGEQRFINEGSSSSKGFELEVEARWPSLQLRASYAYQLSNDDSGDVRVNSPRSLAVATVLVPVGNRQLLGFEGNYIGSRLTLDRTSIDPTVLATASYTLRDVTDGLDLSLGVRNLFDARSPDPGGAEHTQTRIPTEPRTVWLTLTARLGDRQ
jgi:outer membrane receptor protein involved in Fe transport